MIAVFESKRSGSQVRRFTCDSSTSVSSTESETGCALDGGTVMRGLTGWASPGASAYSFSSIREAAKPARSRTPTITPRTIGHRRRCASSGSVITVGWVILEVVSHDPAWNRGGARSPQAMAPRPTRSCAPSSWPATGGRRRGASARGGPFCQGTRRRARRARPRRRADRRRRGERRRRPLSEVAAVPATRRSGSLDRVVGA